VLAEYLDAFGNSVTRVELDRPHNRLQVVAEMDVRLDGEPEIELAEGLGWQRVRDELCYNAQARGCRLDRGDALSGRVAVRAHQGRGSATMRATACGPAPASPASRRR